MFCPNCGSETGNGENFCRNCGAGLKLQKAEAAAVTQPQEAEAAGTAAEAETMVETTETMEAAAAAATAPVQPHETPQRVVLKRREFFKTIAKPQTKKKILALNILTGLMLALCGIGLISAGIYMGEIQEVMHVLNAPGNAQTTVPLMSFMIFVFFCLVDAALYIFVLRFKHFGFAIPLLFLGLYPIILSGSLLFKAFGFGVTTATTKVNGHSMAYYAGGSASLQAASSIFYFSVLLLYGVIITILVLSISVSNEYTRYKRNQTHSYSSQ